MERFVLLHVLDVIMESSLVASRKFSFRNAFWLGVIVLLILDFVCYRTYGIGVVFGRVIDVKISITSKSN
jgi:hypothetical protein